MCTSSPWAPPPPRTDLNTTTLGALPFAYEVGEPAGGFAGGPAAGTLILLHGGAWSSTGAGAAASLRADADRWRGRGWRTVNSTYRPCGRSLDDALALYDAVRARYGASLPVCALGHSAGGHLALMVAARRPGGVRCVVNQAGPTNAASLPSHGAYDDTPPGGTQTEGPTWVHNLMVGAFGQENLPSYSPVAFAGSGLVGTRVLAAVSTLDTVIPFGQMTELRDAMRAADPGAYVDARQLAGGSAVQFVHAFISQAGLDAYLQAERELVASFTSAPPDPVPEPQPPPQPPPAPPPPAAVAPEPPPAAAPVVPPALAPPDRTPPRMRLAGAATQRLGGRLVVEVTCVDEPCSTVARPAVVVPRVGRRKGATFRPQAVRTSIAAGARTKVGMRLSAATRRAARRALTAKRRVRVRVSIAVSDAAGNRRTLARWITLRR